MWRVYNLHHTSVFTYSHENTPLGQSERAYYLSYFINEYFENACKHEYFLCAAIHCFIEGGGSYKFKIIPLVAKAIFQVKAKIMQYCNI